MIGVLTAANDGPIAREFFELFKTPWEPYVPGRSYTALITTEHCSLPPDVPLTLIFSSDLQDIQPMRLERPLQHLGGAVTIQDHVVPIYGNLLTFDAPLDGTGICARVGNRVTGLRTTDQGRTVLRLGYHLFQEVRHLLSDGQPIQYALKPTLDLHIAILRTWMIEAGITFVEIPPAPAGHDFVVCLTHDIDFIGIRTHRFDSTMWGFVVRATAGTLSRFLRGRLSLRRLGQAWLSVVKLPFVYLGSAADFWLPFPWYLNVERGLPVSYYLIPFKGRPGQKPARRAWHRRASTYDVMDVSEWITLFRQAGAEVGVHGIDGWHSLELGKEELARVAAATGESRAPGVRTHWLMADATSPAVLDAAGFDYDSTCGYNETPGYRAGTGQVFQPPGATWLLELPLHIQDGALFYSQRLSLTEQEAWELCAGMIRHARRNGGVLTILWHDRSHAAERFWGDFYRRMLGELKTCRPWFASGRQAVDWFRARRAIAFRRDPQSEAEFAEFRDRNETPQNFILRVHNAAGHPPESASLDLQWRGETQIDLSHLTRQPSIAAAN